MRDRESVKMALSERSSALDEGTRRRSDSFLFLQIHGVYTGLSLVIFSPTRQLADTRRSCIIIIQGERVYERGTRARTRPTSTREWQRRGRGGGGRAKKVMNRRHPAPVRVRRPSVGPTAYAYLSDHNRTGKVSSRSDSDIGRRGFANRSAD